MQMFELLFPLFMIAFPAVTTLFLRTQEAVAQPETQRLERRLWRSTGIALVLLILLWTARILTEKGVLPAILPPLFWHLVPVAVLAQAGFFLLWFRFAMPLIQQYRPGLEGAPASSTESPIRSASLTPRQPPSALHTKSAVWTLGLWLIGFALFLYGWKTHGTPEGKTTFQHLTLCSLGLLAAFSVALVIPLGHRTMFLTPEPLRPNQSPELTAAYRDKHTFQARAILASILLVIALLLVFPLSLAYQWRLSGPELGLFGGALGATLGIAGGVFGTMMSVYRLKIHRIEQAELNGQMP